jgi:Arc/MetJ-type ribon-helix-helix transcriptional regulator
MYLNKRISLRLRSEELKKIKQAVKKNPNYENINHYIRCAIINFERQINKEAKK